jgi:hypothetical protein
MSRQQLLRLACAPSTWLWSTQIFVGTARLSSLVTSATPHPHLAEVTMARRAPGNLLPDSHSTPPVPTPCSHPPNPTHLGCFPAGLFLHWARERHITKHCPRDGHLSRPHYLFLGTSSPNARAKPCTSPSPCLMSTTQPPLTGRPVSATTPFLLPCIHGHR